MNSIHELGGMQMIRIAARLACSPAVSARSRHRWSRRRPPSAKKKIKIKLGTLAPEASAWYDGLRRIGDRWKKASNGRIRFKIYAGGVVGDEGDLHSQDEDRPAASGDDHRRGSAAPHACDDGLAGADGHPKLRGARLRPREDGRQSVKAELEKAGFIVLHWGDAGWVHMFSKVPAKTPADFATAEAVHLVGRPGTAKRPGSAAGLQSGSAVRDRSAVVPADGLVDWYVTTPLFALSSQWFGLTPHMVDVRSGRR